MFPGICNEFRGWQTNTDIPLLVWVKRYVSVYNVYFTLYEWRGMSVFIMYTLPCMSEEVCQYTSSLIQGKVYIINTDIPLHSYKVKYTL
jgi:hypothetical protein